MRLGIAEVMQVFADFKVGRPQGSLRLGIPKVMQVFADFTGKVSVGLRQQIEHDRSQCRESHAQSNAAAHDKGSLGVEITPEGMIVDPSSEGCGPDRTPDEGMADKKVLLSKVFDQALVDIAARGHRFSDQVRSCPWRIWVPFPSNIWSVVCNEHRTKVRSNVLKRITGVIDQRDGLVLRSSMASM